MFDNIKFNFGFTLIELLIVIAIISLLAMMTTTTLINARAKSRDARRLADMAQIKKAMELFYDDNARYPDNNDGVSNSGEVIGSGDDIDDALKTYLPIIPADPLFDGTWENNDDFYYAYDPTHNICDYVVSINRFELQATVDQHGHRDTDSGGDKNINTAHYNYCHQQDRD